MNRRRIEQVQVDTITEIERGKGSKVKNDPFHLPEVKS
jgi:hypothetical protein